MFSKSIVVVALLAGLSAAQTTNTTVNIGALSLTMKAQWCGAQQTACPELCAGQTGTTQNLCDANTLNITCLCPNGTAPGLDYYINTIPTFLCEEKHTECKANNAGDATAQKACDDAEKADCGTLDPASYSAPTSTSTSASSSATAASTTDAAAASATSTSKGAGPTMAVAREGMYALGAAAAFGLLI